MKLVIYDILDEELKDYLLTQEGITNVSLKSDLISKLNIKYNDKISEKIILEHIKLFLNIPRLPILEFDRDVNFKTKTLKHTFYACCEFCYLNILSEFFENNNIKSIKSNIDFEKPINDDIEFTIEYNEKYNINEIINKLSTIYKR